MNMVVITIFQKKTGAEWKERLKLQTKNDTLELPPGEMIRAAMFSKDLKSIRDIKIYVEGD